jgi:hypothetical protein
VERLYLNIDVLTERLYNRHRSGKQCRDVALLRLIKGCEQRIVHFHSLSNIDVLTERLYNIDVLTERLYNIDVPSERLYNIDVLTERLYLTPDF